MRLDIVTYWSKNEGQQFQDKYNIIIELYHVGGLQYNGLEILSFQLLVIR